MRCVYAYGAIIENIICLAVYVDVKDTSSMYEK